MLFKLATASRKAVASAALAGMLAGWMSEPWLTPAAAAASVSASGALPFDDVRDNFAAQAISNMAALHIVTGTGERRFEPDKPVTRAEFMTMLDRLLRIEPVESAISSFSDVPKTAWFYRWVQPAVQIGLAKGKSDTSFEPNRPVTREEAAALIARALKQPLSAGAAPSAPVYRDQARIQAWSLPAVYRLRQLGLMGGDDDGSFRPASPMTRQEAAALLDRIWSYPGWAAEIQAAPDNPIQLGWQYGQSTAQYEKEVQASGINTLSPRSFFLDKNGTIADDTDAALVAWAHGNGKQVWTMVGNRSDQAATHAMLSDAGRRSAFALQLAGLVRQYGLDGLNIDFENMAPGDRQSFTAFISELNDELDDLHAVLSVNVSPDFGTDWTDVFDYAALGKEADYIVLMGYDEHWGGGDPGSVSSLPWLRAGLTTLLKQVSAARVVLALPLYNRDWRSEAGMTVSEEISLLQQNARVTGMRAKASWEETMGQYYAYYGKGASIHRIWLEDGRSLSLKVGLGQSFGVAGYGFWYMGGESLDVWTSMANARRFASYVFD
ncbi:S-layer homology domain-containing protein [Cohnella ginsengisoli]|uniref:S-layer homology domain-containing protein n=1 Tax=Cohnella ginsengisoli TaxID=425004 RepID=A0A9X4KDJ0_9BACL|nr:S-layer homology domain-containing protein [Cohnella ginsengisoli]MDG0789895.1 S-layer homology domain-containing protein [Cohnella ginsengisoli]